MMNWEEAVFDPLAQALAENSCFKISSNGVEREKETKDL
jgi:hypothetical protein